MEAYAIHTIMCLYYRMCSTPESNIKTFTMTREIYIKCIILYVQVLENVQIFIINGTHYITILVILYITISPVLC